MSVIIQLELEGNFAENNYNFNTSQMHHQSGLYNEPYNNETIQTEKCISQIRRNKIYPHM